MGTAGHRASGRRRPVVVAALGVVIGLGGCAGPGGGRVGQAGIAETAAPLLLPDLPPEVGLLGMEREALRDLLGEPAIRRAEQHAEYRRYSLGRCQLDVFLYPDPGTGESEVAYFEVRPAGHQVAGRRAACAGASERLERGAGGGGAAVESH